MLLLLQLQGLFTVGAREGAGVGGGSFNPWDSQPDSHTTHPQTHTHTGKLPMHLYVHPEIVRYVVIIRDPIALTISQVKRSHRRV